MKPWLNFKELQEFKPVGDAPRSLCRISVPGKVNDLGISLFP
uniref:Uncharacterized protein n=1 Tax=Nelumbo nucifera TaxID=4432 RepID=A0A822ZQX4_NELNU|nr:TPA_asm: hypothetical protein HUJ06_004055 [Nelumbo nucifera]